MAFEHYFSQDWKSFTDTKASENLSGCFDCNICLDFAHEPVVTLCGHLYCWPCIYKWLHVQGASIASDEHPQCPVCKADISHTTLVPLYGNGQRETEPKSKTAFKGMAIPPRPAACGNQALLLTASQNGAQLPYENPYQNQNYNPQPYYAENVASSPLVNPGGHTMTGFPHPLAGMFGEMVSAIVFRNSQSLYAYPNSYHLTRTTSPRLRRLEMQADKSLNRISLFLFCCFLLCLVVF